MVKSMFAGVTGLKSHQTKMDVIGNNIANVNTYGFKGSRVTFADVFYQTVTSSSDGTDTLGGTNASQIGYGTAVSSIDVLHTRSGFAPTGRSNDLMIDGEGYFILGPILDADNPDLSVVQSNNLSSTTLTRVGAFSFDANGNLVAANGSGVYGKQIESYEVTADGKYQVNYVEADAEGAFPLQPIKLPTYDELAGAYGITFDEGKDTEIIEASNVSFGSNGKITATVQDAAGKSHILELGQLAVANVPNPSGLELSGSTEFKIGGNAGAVAAFVPSEGPTGALISGGLEMSNVDLTNEFADMITTQRGFQANSKIITVTDEMLAELVNMK